MLAQKLRRQRIAAGITQDQAAAEVDRDATTIGRWEQGHAGARRRDIQDLAKLYGTSAAETARMTALLLQAGERGIWEGANVPAHLRVFYESELLAETVRYLDLDYVPGLLQTPEYLAEAQSVRANADAERDVQVQRNYQQRQADVIHGERQPRLEFVIGLAALEYLRDTAVFEVQVAALREVNALAHVDIRVLTRLHAAMDGSFALIDPGDGLLEPFVFVEALDGCRYIETRDVVSQYRAAFQAARSSAKPLEEYLK